MDTAAFARRYDLAIFDPQVRALYDGSDFFNVGDWDPDPAGPPRGLGEAAQRLIARHLAVDPPETAAAMRVVLDVACGLGASTATMARHYAGALVLGTNVSTAQLHHAARRAPSAARFAVMDAAHLAVADNTVDRIHVVEAAFHFDTRFDFLCEAHRVLRPGGKVVLTDIFYRRPLPDVPQANIWRDRAEYAERCAAAGLVVERFDDVTDHTSRPFCDYVEARGQRAYARILRRVIAAYCFIVLGKQN